MTYDVAGVRVAGHQPDAGFTRALRDRWPRMRSLTESHYQLQAPCAPTKIRVVRATARWRQCVDVVDNGYFLHIIIATTSAAASGSA